MLVGGVHDAPTDEGTRTVHRYALVDVADAATAFVVYVPKGGQYADACRAHRALHRHFDNVDGIEEGANYGSDYGAGKKLLYGLGEVVFL